MKLLIISFIGRNRLKSRVYSQRGCKDECQSSEYVCSAQKCSITPLHHSLKTVISPSHEPLTVNFFSQSTIMKGLGMMSKLRISTRPRLRWKGMWGMGNR
jgi:hypothetical protein